MQRWHYLVFISINSLYFANIAALDLQPTSGIPTTGGNNNNCTCVPKYLCKNGSVITSGEGLIDIRRDDTPCQHYLLTCCKKEDQTLVPLTTSYMKPPNGCGYRRANGVGFKITGNKENESEFGEFPWVVAVLGNENYQCGGALIHPNVVITAAHCVTNKEKTFSVRAGEWDTQHVIEPYPHQEVNVKSVKIHPDYYAGALFNDIAFLVLGDSVNITDNIDVMCLPPQNHTSNISLCYANGWGKKIFDSKDRYQSILKKVGLPLVDRDICEEKLRSTRLGSRFKLDKSFICAGGEPGKDTCIGDGGGPLVCPIDGQEDRYYHTGIVSWGIGCGDEGVPGVYTNVALFRDWIDDQMKINNFDPSSYQF